MAKVLLVNPPRFNELIGKNPAIVEKHRGFNPPLGVLSLAGYLEAHSGHEVEVLDTQPPGWNYEELKTIVGARRFDVCGITAMTFTLIDVILMCRVVRQVAPHAKIVLGGPHVHLFPEETIKLPEVDYLVQGEGEIVFKEFLDAIDSNKSPAAIAGVVSVQPDGRMINNGIAPATSDLDTLGMPARHLLDVNMYTSLLGRDNVITTMFTSRGCPYRCTFCDRPFSPVLSGFRWRSAAHIADEIQQCLSLGIKEAFIYDDTFTVRKDRVHELCDEIIKRGLKFRWDVRAHVNTVNQELLDHMAAAGCDRIHYGVECGNDRMMRVIRKNTTVDRVRQAVEWTKKSGMEVLAYFIIGQQTETAEDIRDTMRLAKQLDPNYAHFTIFCPYPGTEIYAHGLKTGIIKSDVWRAFALDPQPEYELPVWEENFTRQELREMLVKCYRSFYLRPGYILRNVSRIRGAGELGRKIRAGMSVLTMTPDQKVYGKGLRHKARDLVPNSPIDVHTG